MTTPLSFKSGQFYGDVHQGARGSIFDIRRMKATRSEDEVATHRHDDAHFVLVLSGVYISSARHAPPRAPAPTLVFNPAGTTHRDRFLDGKGSFMTVSLDPALLMGAEELHAAQEAAIVLRESAGTAAAFGIAREIGRGGDVALLEAGAWEMLASLHSTPQKARPSLPAWAHQAYEAVMDLATDTHLRIADVAAALGVHPVHLARVFRQAWGCSPGDLLRWRRVEQASGLMRRPDLSMADVALSVGFADQSHMNRAFRARYGMTPSNYRRQMFQTSKTMPDLHD
ncbi:AraC family transcriptional regulator [Janthinobacterium sp. AD80]|uniref:helix-turn-helix transcriptional regulator n=1 Tax=Janthinobacterium sp. AD80 TaxID=1528773 RepID=UPI000C84051E|nr:AraC family transcriptional regulator [Janthinobacterium sp. AD80]PMQ13014.1 HTH-type transcriptional regulator ChbR [Janthinobacterium sp. AD80]